MDMKALQFKNKKLWEKIEQRRRAESELMQKIESLEAKQSAADATLSLVNRQWSQVLSFVGKKNIVIYLKLEKCFFLLFLT